MTVRALLASALVLVPAAAPAAAQSDDGTTTRVQVRALSRDAKLIGDAVGGVRITIIDDSTGAILASGVTTGATGDTDLIMTRRRTRGGAVYATPGAAGWLAELRLERPTTVRFEAEGPLDYPQATARASRTMRLVPGRHVEGDGVVLELNGLIVEVLDAGSAAAGRPLPVRARVRMLCSCPTAPGGTWSVERVEARLLRDGRVVASAPLPFAGEASVYAGTVTAPAAGDYTLQVVASDPPSANFGTVERTITVR